MHPILSPRKFVHLFPIVAVGAALGVLAWFPPAPVTGAVCGMDGAAKSPTSAASRWICARGCELGRASACTSRARKEPLAVANRETRGWVYPAMAIPWLRRACDSGDATGCADLAAEFRRNEPVHPPIDEELALAERACEQGSRAGCVTAWMDYWRTGKADRAALIAFRGCDLGDSVLCGLVPPNDESLGSTDSLALK